MLKSRIKIFLFSILILSAILRLALVPRFPYGFNLDETSQGYTAYSLLLTGRDEWGKRLPLSPRAFGDYRSPLYTYLIIPSIAVFGLTEYAVRLPAAIFGVLAVLAVYLFIKELLKNQILALWTAFFLAISPWHISLSRGAFEASLNTFLLPLGLWLFLLGLRRWPYLVFSGLVLGLNLFSYYSPRFFTPLAVVMFLIFFAKDFFKKRQNFIFFPVFGLFIFLAFYTFFTGGSVRVVDTSILNPVGGWVFVANRQYEAAWLGFPSTLVKIFNNKLVFSASRFYKQYLSYFSFDFLFSEGAGESTYGMVQGRGVLYLYELVLLIVSFITLVKKKEKQWWLLFILLLLSPVPASLAKGFRAANRAVTMLPFWQFFSAAGLVYLISLVKVKRIKTIVTSLAVLIPLFFLSIFLEDYFFHAPYENAKGMAYGWPQIKEYLKENDSRFDKVVFSGEVSEPQIALAFFLKMSPEKVQSVSSAWLDYQKQGYLFVDQLPEYHLGKFEFRNFHFPEDQHLAKTLFIGKPEDFAGVDGQVEKIIYYPGPEEKVAFKLVKFEP